jgi:hypothetical protein
MSEVKRCGRCGEVKPLDDFHRFKGHSSGRQAYCRTCAAESNREWRSDPAVKARLAEYMRVYRRRKKMAEAEVKNEDSGMIETERPL